MHGVAPINIETAPNHWTNPYSHGGAVLLQGCNKDVTML